jgi:hypothetical protein
MKKWTKFRKMIGNDDNEASEGASFIKLTGTLKMISICDMVYFLTLVNQKKFQILFNSFDVKRMVRNSMKLREFYREPGQQYYQAKIITGEPLIQACHRLP